MDDEKPDTRHLVLKPRVVVPTDGPAVPGGEAAISVQGIHSQNVQADERRRNAKRANPDATTFGAPVQDALSPVFKPAQITPLNAPVRPGDENAINVKDILMENGIADHNSGWGRVKRKKRSKSRRTRDFLIVVGLVDISIGLVMKIAPGIVTLVYGLSAITLVTMTLGWIMFFVMDAY
jgi:hypothetical protein